MKNNTSHPTSILTRFAHIGDIVNSYLGAKDGRENISKVVASL